MILYAFIAALLTSSATTAYTKSQARNQTCQAFQAYNASFTKLIRESEKSLPKFAYYKTHPEDLARAIKADEHSIRVLSSSVPNYCH